MFSVFRQIIYKGKFLTLVFTSPVYGEGDRGSGGRVVEQNNKVLLNLIVYQQSLSPRLAADPAPFTQGSQ